MAVTPADARTMLARAMSEDELQAHVMDALQQFGWVRVHFRPARTEKGWRTLLQGDKGFPDITAIRQGRGLVAELKSERAKKELPAEQEWWLTNFEATGWEAHVWRPSDWLSGRIEEVLR